MVWEVTYDLTGSAFEITGTSGVLGDGVFPVEAPYDDDGTVGPGTMKIRFQDDGGVPGAGTILITDYELQMDFAVNNGNIENDLVTGAGPDGCGVTGGTLAGTLAVWDPATMVGYSSVGTITCNLGGLCGLGGLADGENPVDDAFDLTGLPAFQFGDDFTSFSASQFQLQSDDDSTTLMTWQGTETSRELVGSAACGCG